MKLLLTDITWNDDSAGTLPKTGTVVLVRPEALNETEEELGELAMQDLEDSLGRCFNRFARIKDCNLRIEE